VLNLEGFGYESSEAIRDEVLGKQAEFVSGLDNGLNGIAISLPATTTQLQRIAEVPINFADPLARRAPALQQTADSGAPVARINAQTLALLGVTVGETVRVKQGQGEAVLVAKADASVPVGCIRVAAAHVSTAALGAMFGPISVERA